MPCRYSTVLRASTVLELVRILIAFTAGTRWGCSGLRCTNFTGVPKPSVQSTPVAAANDPDFRYLFRVPATAPERPEVSDLAPQLILPLTARRCRRAQRVRSYGDAHLSSSSQYPLMEAQQGPFTLADSGAAGVSKCQPSRSPPRVVQECTCKQSLT